MPGCLLQTFEEETGSRAHLWPYMEPCGESQALRGAHDEVETSGLEKFVSRVRYCFH